MNIREEARKMKLDAPVLAASSNDTRNAALRLIGEELTARKEEIFAANAEDCRAAEEDGVAQAVMKRLRFNEDKLGDVCKGIEQLVSLPDPIGRILLKRELDAGLVLTRISVPIGVIGVIFEARPDALVQISTLCLKSGNCAILKGGKETVRTNRALFSIIHDAAVTAGLPASCLLQAELHNEIDELLQCEEDVDLLIPRGSNQFVQYIMNHTKIPVMGHADGICHIYVDKDVDEEMAVQVLLDAKTQYTAACNAVETVLIHRDIAPAFLPRLARAFHAAGVRLRGTQEAEDIVAASPHTASETETIEIMDDDEFRTEYLDLIASVKIVGSIDEAIDHIKAAGVPLVVAINKIDKPGANPDRVIQELMEHGLVPEEYGGDNIMVPVSAKKQIGINELLENILLVAEVQELKANPNREARGVVIEAQLDKGRGTVEVLGLNDVPAAGDIFAVLDEKQAKSIAEHRIERQRTQLIRSKKVSLDDLFQQIQEGSIKDLNIVVKADVQGSVEALNSSLLALNKNDEVRVSIVHSGVGAVNESDVMLASASNALIIAFNVRPDANARRVADAEEIDIRTYRVIYDALNDVKAAMSGMLAPKFKEVVQGRVEIRMVMKFSKALVAGSYVLEGKIFNNSKIRIIRDNIEIFDGEIDSLRRFKDEVKEVAAGYECGISIVDFRDFREGDIIEAYTMEEVETSIAEANKAAAARRAEEAAAHEAQQAQSSEE